MSSITVMLAGVIALVTLCVSKLMGRQFTPLAHNSLPEMTVITFICADYDSYMQVYECRMSGFAGLKAPTCIPKTT